MITCLISWMAQHTSRIDNDDNESQKFDKSADNNVCVYIYLWILDSEFFNTSPYDSKEI